MEGQILTGHSEERRNGFLTSEMKRRIEWITVGIITVCWVVAGIAQNDGLKELNYQAQSNFEPSIKDAIKFADLPEIKDTVRRIKDVKYGITSVPIFPKYQVQAIDPAKMQNEPLNKLYHSLLKVGYAPIYNMPLAEFSISNQRSKNQSYGARLKHFSSDAHLRDVGYSGFADNSARVFGRRFYRKHTLSGDIGFTQNMVHYYGYDTSVYYEKNKNVTKQQYRLIDPSLRLQSHYTDSTHVNHDLGLGFYNYQNIDKETENNVRFNGMGNMFLNKEKLNLGVLVDFYNHKQTHDTLNDLIVTLNPSFEAKGKKWTANVGVAGTIDNFRDKTKFFFYPIINMEYDIYESIVIPYAGVSGGLIKNGLRSLSTENPFIDSTVNYRNTNNRYNLFGGLRGNISSNLSYDAKLSYSSYDSLHFFVINYSDANPLNNRYQVIYDNSTLLNVSGQLQYRAAERLNLIAKGNYYLYKPKNLLRAYHKPDLDMTFSAIYNIKSKIILRGDLYILGKQFSRVPKDSVTYAPKLIKGWGDVNLEAEYRYSKMLSFFVRFNNIANQRYYRWDQYPRQRFNFMAGLTFVPF
jgi:hypothetical protein